MYWILVIIAIACSVFSVDASENKQPGINLNANGMSLNIVCDDHHRPVFSEPVNCPDAYVRNPFSNTCLRLVIARMSWDQAKAKCEQDDGYLAVIDGVEAVNWFEHFRRTTPGMIHTCMC